MDRKSLIFFSSWLFLFCGIQLWFAPQKHASNKSITSSEIASSPTRIEAPVQTSPVENFYVLENQSQQCVFSTQGGAIAEINLPFQSGSDLVKETTPDRKLAEEAPRNALFPLYPSQFLDGQHASKHGGYYPLLRRSLLSADGRVFKRVDSRHYAGALLAETVDLAHTPFQVTRFEKDLIQFEAKGADWRVLKTFSLGTTPYTLDLRVETEGLSHEKIWVSSGVPEAELVGGSFSPLIRYQTHQGRSVDVETVSLSHKKPLFEALLHPEWVSNSNGFLGMILRSPSLDSSGVRITHIPGNEVVTRLSLLNSAHALYPADDYPGTSVFLPLTPSHSSETFHLFAGPFDQGLLQALSENSSLTSEVDYTDAQTSQGWFSFISRPFTQFLAFLMDLFYSITHSWGISIILLTIALRLMTYPLNNWSLRSMAKVREFAPKEKEIRERYKKDPKRAQMELMLFYQKEGINPLMSGCLPMLLQLPFLTGMFYLLKSSLSLRGASFIPGWIDDLSAPDILFEWHTPIIWIGTQFHLLPILSGLTMLLQGKLSAVGKDPNSEAQRQQRATSTIFSVILILMFYKMPAGLNIYFLFSTLLNMLQQWAVTRHLESKKTSATTEIKKY